MAETGRQRYWRQVRQIASEENISIQAARRRWRARVTHATRLLVQAAGELAGQAARPVVRVARPVVRLVSRSAPTTCPLCRDDLVAPLHQCGCHAAYHLECAWEIPRCAVLGCGRQMPRMERMEPTTPAAPIDQPTSVARSTARSADTRLDRIVRTLFALSVLFALIGLIAAVMRSVGGG